ncbi:DUF5635 domain-containing protein [Micromonospora sp. NPDC048935]|uniref:DUF5635 domain-containing protein n=1 Tax=Micromonospora sp. NPDC048935 TaxID=3364262 RepID=UPI0037176D4B
MLPFSPGADLVEARDRLRVLVDGVLTKLAEGVLPTEVERERIDCKEEAGRRGPGGTLLVGDPHNKEAARQLANEVTCMANTPGGGALLVGIEDRTGQLLGAGLDVDWLRHRVYELVGIAPAVEERRVDGVRLLVIYVAEAREPAENLDGQIRWRTGGHCVGVDRAEWWLHRQLSAGHDPMAQVTERTERDISPGAVAVARRYLAQNSKADVSAVLGGSVRELLTSLGVLRPDGRLTAAGALTFCPADRTHITLSVLDVEGGDLITAPRDLAGLSLLEQVAAIDDRLETLNKSVRVTQATGFAQPHVRQLPPQALREAVLNGVVHRDWMQPDPVSVTWVEEDSAVQVVSPGGFVGGITSDTVLTQRYARYPALADLFRALQLVEKQGLGVDRMYRDMVALGHRPPVLVEEGGPRVRTRLVGGTPVLPVMNLMGAIRPEVRQRDVKVALIVHALLHEPFVTAHMLTHLLQRGESEVLEALEVAAECSVGQDALITQYKDVWTLTWGAISIVNKSSGHEVLRRRGVLRHVKPDVVAAQLVARQWLSTHERYSSGDHSTLTGLTYAGARGQLERLEQAGLLRRGEGSGRSAHFVAGPQMTSAPVEGFPT